MSEVIQHVWRCVHQYIDFGNCCALDETESRANDAFAATLLIPQFLLLNIQLFFLLPFTLQQWKRNPKRNDLKTLYNVENATVLGSVNC